MNPDTGRFEELRTEIEQQVAEAKGWSVFEPGEIVIVKGQRFRIVDVAVTHLILRALTAEQGA